jgi:hypothetical protein
MAEDSALRPAGAGDNFLEADAGLAHTDALEPDVVGWLIAPRGSALTASSKSKIHQPLTMVIRPSLV